MLDEMRAFAVLAEAGSIQRVAERLFLTQSAVTRQIQRLESELGATLLDRRAKPPTLTPVGRTVLEHCRSILKSVADLKASTSSGQEPSGILRIGIGNAFADDDMADRLRDLGRRFPRLAVHVKTDWTPLLIEQLTQGRLDIAVLPKRPGVALPPDLSGKVLASEPLVFVAGGGTKLPKHVSLEHLATLHWVLKPHGCGTRETLRHLLERAGLSLTIATEVSDEQLQLSLIARGLGVGLVSERSVRRRPRSDKIRVFQVPGVALSMDVASVRGNFLGCLGAAVDAFEQGLGARFARSKPS